MEQQINLYRVLPKQPKHFFSAKLIFFVCVAFLLLLVINSIQLSLEYDSFKTKYNEAVKNRDKLYAALTNLKVSLLTTNNVEEIQSKNKILLQEVNFKKQLREQSTQNAGKKITGFSLCLVDIAEASLPNAWLRKMTI